MHITTYTYTISSFRQATEKGEGLSKAFEEYATAFGFPDWPHFHKTWTAVRTRFIDDCIRKTGRLIQIRSAGLRPALPEFGNQ